MKYLLLTLILVSTHSFANCGTAKTPDELLDLVRAGLSISELKSILSYVEPLIKENKLVSIKIKSNTCVVIDLKSSKHIRKGNGIRYLFKLKDKHWVLDTKSTW